MRYGWLALGLMACDGGDGDGGDDTEVTGDPVEIAFRGAVGDADFACGGSYDGIGTAGSTYVAGDLRFYVHDVVLVDDAGDEVPVALTQDGQWQHEGLALIDLEDGDAACEAGTPEQNDRITGTVEPGHTFTGLQFKLGVPADLNHLDSADAPAPLDVSSMYWVWLSGRKFVRVDGKVADPDATWLLHLGSTACPGGNPQAAPSGACANPNVGAVALDGFDPASSTVVADIASLLAASDLTQNGMDPGCMSGAEDPECAVLLPRLGVDFGDTMAEQAFFRVE